MVPSGWIRESGMKYKAFYVMNPKTTSGQSQETGGTGEGGSRSNRMQSFLPPLSLRCLGCLSFQVLKVVVFRVFDHVRLESKPFYLLAVLHPPCEMNSCVSDKLLGPELGAKRPLKIRLLHIINLTHTVRP